MRTFQLETGSMTEADNSNERLMALAKSVGDNDMVIDGRIYQLHMLLKKYRFAEVRAGLAEIDAVMGSSPGLLQRVHRRALTGRMQSMTGNFDKAAQAYLDALTLAQQLPHRAKHEMQIIDIYLMHLYVNTKDPERALALGHEALTYQVEQPDPNVMSDLNYAMGVSLLRLKRDREAFKYFDKALAICRSSGLAMSEAFVLVNMADAHLRAHRWIEAERASRETITVATRNHDETARTVARANLGFALGGQGRIAEALPWIDGVIADFRKAGAHQDLEATLDEKSRMFERSGMMGEALTVVREQQTIQKAIFDADRLRAVTELQEKFDADQKRRAIELLQRENQLKDAAIRNRELRQMVTSLVIVLALALGGFLYVLYRRAGKSNTLLRDMNGKLEYLATRDPLTGLYNRRSFVDRMKQRGRVENDRRHGVPHAADSLVLMDIDHFKSVNDTYGHAAGDAVLVEVAKRVQSVVRDTDMVLRWGGEEFVVFSLGADSRQVHALVERILAAVGQAPVMFGDIAIHVTTSAGYAAVPFTRELAGADGGWEKSVALADAALYLSKENGRNRGYGVLQKDTLQPNMLSRIEADLAEAAREGLVDLEVVHAPPSIQIDKP